MSPFPSSPLNPHPTWRSAWWVSPFIPLLPPQPAPHLEECMVSEPLPLLPPQPVPHLE